MLGKKNFEPKFLYNISLQDLVPANDFYRFLERILDLNFIYKACEPLYGTTGNKSIDPVVFFKINLLGFFENIISDRELIRRASDSLAARLYLGYDLDEELPWHSTISRTRALMPERLFEDIFYKVVKMCSDAGLIEGSHQSIDSTLVKANASLEKIERVIPKLNLEKFIEETRKINTVEQPTDLSTGQAGSEEENKISCDQLNFIKNPERIKRTSLSNKNYKSKTDIDSRIAKKPGKPVNLYYTVHYAVDSQARVITDVLASHSDKSDSSVLMEVVQRVEKRINSLNMEIKSVGADKNYCSGEILEQLEKKKIEPYIPTQKHPNTTGGLDKKEFIYDELRDIYICPENHELTYKYTNKKKARLYFAKINKCQTCPIKERCIQDKKRRRVQHSIYRKEYERLSDRMNSSIGKRMMRIRKTHTEPLFAEAKRSHGLSQFLTIGLSKSQKKTFVIATVQNLKRLVRYLKRDAGKIFSQILKSYYQFKELKINLNHKIEYV